MFEKQYTTKDLNLLKNKLSQNIPDKFKLEISDNSIEVLNKRNSVIFKGNISSTPIGCIIRGNFPIEGIVSKIAMVFVTLYVIALLGIYYTGIMLYDYQIGLMILGVVFIFVIRKIVSKNSDEVKNIFINLENI